MIHVKAALRETDHRPWPLPDEPWVTGLRWSDQLLAHWPVPAAALRPAVPEGLALDTRDGVAWLGIVPFEVSRARLRGTVPVPGFSRFPEIDVRTYVIVGERPGIYYLSLDTTLWAVVGAARRKYRLPYNHARIGMRRRPGGQVSFSARRRRGQGPGAAFEASYGPVGGRLDFHPGSLERWLTERYCVYSVDERGRVLRGEIHHAPRPLHVARAEIALNTMADPFGAPLDGSPLLHFSPRQEVVAWPFRHLGGGG